MVGAFSPIGCLRLDSALQFFHEEARYNLDTAATNGFSAEEVLGYIEEFPNTANG